MLALATKCRVREMAEVPGDEKIDAVDRGHRHMRSVEARLDWERAAANEGPRQGGNLTPKLEVGNVPKRLQSTRRCLGIPTAGLGQHRA